MKNNPVDILRFVEGWNFDLYNQLGAHPIIQNNEKGYLFRVYAPNAVSVNLIGDFNNFQYEQSYEMTLTDHGIWEIFVLGVEKNTHYKYLIKTHSGENLEKADPFAFYSDSFPYFNSITYDLDNFSWTDDQWLQNRQDFDYKVEPMMIYEIHLGSWRKGLNDTGGDEGKAHYSYQDLAKELIPFLKANNYNYVEFLPLLEHPFLGSWGYQVTGFFSPTCRYGNPEELKMLINELHKNCIGVIFDFVPVHYCKDKHGLDKFDGTHIYSFSNESDRENLDWGTANFNLGKNEVQSFLISSIFYWIKEFHIDGYRIDAVSYMIYYGGNHFRGENPDGINFLKNLNSQVSKHFPWVIKIAEDSSFYYRVTGKINDRILGFDLKWDLGFSNDMFAFVKKGFAVRNGDAFNDVTFSCAYKDNENYLLAFSHDEVVHMKGSFLNKQFGFDWFQKFAGLRLMLGYQVTHPGKKLKFMGTEFGQFKEWNHNYSLDWNLLEVGEEKLIHLPQAEIDRILIHQKTLQFNQDLNQIYLDNLALYEADYHLDGFRWMHVYNNDCILIYSRHAINSDNFLVCVHNFNQKYFSEYWIKVPKADGYEEILNSDNLKYGGKGAINHQKLTLSPDYEDPNSGWIKVKLSPLTVLILKPIRPN